MRVPDHVHLFEVEDPAGRVAHIASLVEGADAAGHDGPRHFRISEMTALQFPRRKELLAATAGASLRFVAS
jgi:hypothetical protein